MEYKVLIKLYVPEIEKNYEMYIPINKTVSQVNTLINRLINNITNGVYPIKNKVYLYNRKTSELYSDSIAIRNTDIRNGTELVLDSKQFTNNVNAKTKKLYKQKNTCNNKFRVENVCTLRIINKR